MRHRQQASITHLHKTHFCRVSSGCWGAGVSRPAPQILERLTLLCGLSSTFKANIVGPCPLSILLLVSRLCLSSQDNMITSVGGVLITTVTLTSGSSSSHTYNILSASLGPV